MRKQSAKPIAEAILRLLITAVELTLLLGLVVHQAVTKAKKRRETPVEMIRLNPKITQEGEKKKIHYAQFRTNKTENECLPTEYKRTGSD